MYFQIYKVLYESGSVNVQIIFDLFPSISLDVIKTTAEIGFKSLTVCPFNEVCPKIWNSAKMPFIQ